MSLTLTDILDRLLREDEVSILEILNIDTEMLLDRFSDIIEDKQDYLEELLDDEE